VSVPPSNRWIPVLLTQEGLPDNRDMLYVAQPCLETPCAFSAGEGGWRWPCGS
ncbi:hypothetical protein NDU88_007601, partial [Pleurodeles waltl]